MKICGIQKLSLIDYPDKVACTIFIYGCNFRCGFCHNPDLVIRENKQEISQQEILDFLEKRKGILDGVCITGGEPLMNIDIEFLIKIKSLGYSIKIDTNGSFPGKLKQIVELGLIDYVAMDIKSSPERYEEITNSKIFLANIEDSIKIISQLPSYEFRTTILEELHPKDEVEKMAKWLNMLVGQNPKKFILQGFKSQGNLIDAKFNQTKGTSKEYLQELKDQIQDYFEWVDIRI